MTPVVGMTKQEAFEGIRERMTPVTAGQKYSIRRFEPGDAWGVARLFYEVYGEDYPVEDSYIPERLIAAHAEGRQRTVVAVAADGTVIGQGAFFRSSPPNPSMFEYGQMLILREYRNGMIAARMHQFATAHMAGKDGVVAMYGEAVCNHVVTQKMSLTMLYYGCAMELGLMPSEAYAHEGAVGRVSCLLMARIDEDVRQTRYVPGCWADLAAVGFKDFAKLERDVLPAAPQLPAAGVSHVEERNFAYAGVTRVNVHSAGADFENWVDGLVARCADRGDTVIQCWLAMGSEHVGGAAEVLRKAGFYCGGVVPCWFAPGQGGDAMLVQRFLKPAELAIIRLFNEDAENLCRLVLADMERAGREFGAPVPKLLSETEGQGA